MSSNKNIAIVGGGVTGLSAAWEVQSNTSTAYSLLEQDLRWGGKVISARLPAPGGGSFTIDGGPESFITRKPEAWDLVHALGLQDQLGDPGSETSHMYVLTHGRPLAVPLNPALFITSPILSTRGKLRMLAEPFIPPRRDPGDESLANFVTRRLGRPALEAFLGPVLAGIYNTDPERQSILVSSPVMREMEAEYGSLVKAMLGRMRTARAARRQQKQAETASRSAANSRPRFFTFQSGAESLIHGLRSHLTGDLHLGCQVNAITRVGESYHLEVAGCEPFSADAVILATPANHSASLLAGVAPTAARALSAIRHENIGTATLIYRPGDVHTRMRIHGLMVPRRERRAIDAITFTSLKMPARAPAGYTLVRLFFGGSAPEVVELDDAGLLAVLRRELSELLGITAAPLDMVAYRWPRSFPQADVGHLDRLEQLEQQLPPGIFLAGSSYRGIGVPDCIRQGRDAAAAAVQYLSN